MSEEFNIEQLKWAMDEISEAADCARKLSVQAIAETTSDQNREAIRLVALRTVIEKIGCIAGLHGKCCDDRPAEWLLPPAYHDAAKSSAEAPVT